jgi:hypothetical protein
MAEDKFHMFIPPANVDAEKINKQGRSKSYFRENYSDHGLRLRKEAELVLNIEAKKKDFNLMTDLFMQVEAPSKIPIKDFRSNIENLGFQLVSFQNDLSDRGIVKITKEKFSDLGAKLNEYIDTNRRKNYFSPIENLSSIPAESKIENAINTISKKNVSVIFNLYNSFSLNEKFAINQAIVNELNRFNGNASEPISLSNGTTFISCSLSPKVVPVIAGQFSSIKEVLSDRISFVETSIETQDLPKELKILKPKSQSCVCIIDSGINSSSSIFSGLVTDTLPNWPTGSTDCDYKHGTFVASRCVFGDNIDSCLGSFSLEPYCKIISVQIFGIDQFGKRVETYNSHIARVIDKVVLKLHKTVKVYNLSFASEEPIENGKFSLVAKLLDSLSKKYRVLFVVASGNIRATLGKYPSKHFTNPLARIGAPAEALLALTVGSFSRYENTDSLSKANEISPFSKIGPGADMGIKPEVVAHGGNMIIPYTNSPRVSTYGISADGKRLAADVGTSFSAPLISQYAQRIFDAYPDCHPNLVKALLCHFANKKKVLTGIVGDQMNFTGFGEPIIESAIEARPHNAVYLFEGKLDQDNYQYITFHVPKTLASGAEKSKLKIRITIVYDPPVAQDNSAEYSKTRISLALIKPTDSSTREIGFSGKDDYKHSWNPIVKVEKTFNRNYKTGAWRLKLHLYTRGNVSKKYVQEYAAVIEVLDERNYVTVYDDIKKEFGGIYKKYRFKKAA